MIRRWLIRLPCLVALTLVVGVWITSYFGGIVVGGYIGGRALGVDAVQGLGAFLEVPYPSHTSHIQFDYQPFATAKSFDLEPTTLGFRIDTAWQTNPGVLLIAFPLWLPTVVLAMLCWYVWRKTRGKYNGRAFPVELTKKSEG